MDPQGWRAGPRPLTALAMVAVLVIAAGCTRTHDLVAAPTDETTTTARLPVRSVPRRVTTTTTTAAAAPAAEVAGATTSVVPAPAPPPTAKPAARARPRNSTATTLPISALIAALRNATTTTRPPSAPAPTPTTTTSIPANPAGVRVTAQNPLVHHGETQTIAVDAENSPTVPALVGCAGRDYRVTSAGFVAAGFATPTSCAVVGDAAHLVRTLPANLAYGQYVFCTEINPATPTTVCTFYVAVPYPS